MLWSQSWLGENKEKPGKVFLNHGVLWWGFF